jgi:hypothetical protein
MGEEPIHDTRGGRLRRLLETRDMDIGSLRRLVGAVDAGKILDAAGQGLGAEALRIAAAAFLQRHVDKDLRVSRPDCLV